MRIDAALAERLQPDAGHEAAARVAPALDLEILVIDVEGRGPSPATRMPSSLPVAQAARPRGCSGCLASRVAGFLLVEDQADDVVRALLVERLLQAADR